MENKRKPRQMIKAPIIFIVILVIFIVLGYLLQDNRYLKIINNNKLKNKGSSNEEIILINNYPNSLEYALNNEYNKDLITIIKDGNYIDSNIYLYIDYININKGVGISTSIEIVNEK